MSENIKNEDIKETVNDQPDALNARLDAIENDLKATIEKQDATIEKQAQDIADLKNKPGVASQEDDDAILVDRQSAHTMRLPVVNDMPIIEGKSERVVGVTGLEYLMKVKTIDGEEYSFPLGCDISKIDFKDKALKDVETTSYENLKTVNFKLQDIDTNDLTGASKLDKGQIVGEGGVIPEVDRTSGSPVMTGRKIRTVVRRDVRHYTIEHGGEKATISSEMLGNIRT